MSAGEMVTAPPAELVAGVAAAVLLAWAWLRPRALWHRPERFVVRLFEGFGPVWMWRIWDQAEKRWLYDDRGCAVQFDHHADAELHAAVLNDRGRSDG